MKSLEWFINDRNPQIEFLTNYIKSSITFTKKIQRKYLLIE